MTRASLTAPVFRAIEVPGTDGAAGHLVTWCPWCETVHRHGAGGGGGNRAAHCATASPSPLSLTGYDLDWVGSGASEAAIVPDGLMVGQARLCEALDKAAPELRRAAVRAILGKARVGGGVVSRRLAKGTAWLFGASRWLIERTGGRRVEGDGLLRLAGELYGVSPGIAAVRILEAASAETLDAEAAFAIQQAIDDWAACGAPKRGADL